jgi:hypothetical protein
MTAHGFANTKPSFIRIAQLRPVPEGLAQVWKFCSEIREVRVTLQLSEHVVIDTLSGARSGAFAAVGR